MIEDKYELIDKELLEFVEDVLLNRCENATERMLEYAATLEPKCKPTAVRKLGTAAAAGAKAKADSWRDLAVGAGWWWLCATQQAAGCRQHWCRQLTHDCPTRQLDAAASC